MRGEGCQLAPFRKEYIHVLLCTESKMNTKRHTIKSHWLYEGCQLAPFVKNLHSYVQRVKSIQQGRPKSHFGYEGCQLTQPALRKRMLKK